MEKPEKKVYCSSCRHSKYVQDPQKLKRLYCELRRSFGQSPFLPKDSRAAEDCLEYAPERLRDSLTTRESYLTSMRKCKVPLSEEKGGVLKDVKLD